MLAILPATAWAETTGVSTSSDTGSDATDTDTDGATDTDAVTDTASDSTTEAPWEPIHDSTEGPPLYEGPRENGPPLQIQLDDDGFCRVGRTGSGLVVVAGLLLLGFVRRRA